MAIDEILELKKEDSLEYVYALASRSLLDL